MALLKKKTIEAAAPAAHPSAPRLVAATANVLLHPLVTEKAARLASLNQYAFAVAPSATKVQIIQAVVARYGVRPKHVTVINTPGKAVAGPARSRGRRRDQRKAIVTVPAGTSLTVMEGV